MRCAFAVLCVGALLSLALPFPNAAAGVLCQTHADSASAAPSSPALSYFNWRNGTAGVDLSARDLEFHWDSTYGTGLSNAVRLTLESFQRTLTETNGPCVLVRDAKNLQGVYNYFRRQGSDWDTSNPRDSAALVVGNDWNAGNDNDRPADIGTGSYWARDRAHVDVYITRRTGPGDYGGQFYPPFYSPREDLDTGHPFDEVRHHNSIQVTGPYTADALDPTGTGWTAPGKVQWSDFDHEFQHALPGYISVGQDLNSTGVGELWSAGAEVMAGIPGPTDVDDDVPYTWPLLANSRGSVDPSYVRQAGQNYQNRTSFMAYVAYNYLGPDSSRTLAGMRDDLMFRWNRDNRALPGLINLLGDDSCATCAGKPYFQGLNKIDRFNLLMHNWRVASFVNNPAVADSQYGWPAWSGFSPAYNLRAWQAVDPYPEDDIVAMPAVVSIGPSQAVRETALAGMRTFQGNSFPLTLAPTGSAYWAFRADPQMASLPGSLVIRVSAPTRHAKYQFAEWAFELGLPHTLDRYPRLMASVVGYGIADSGAGSVLWRHPEAVTFVSPARWTDTDSLAEEIELEVPGFGSTNRTAVVVLSLGDPSGGWFSESTIPYEEVQPYRLEVSVRRNQADTLGAVSLCAATGMSELTSSWSPRGDHIAYTKWPIGQDLLPGLPWIYRRPVGGGPEIAIAATTSSLIAAQCPDWSPRGDLVAFEGLTSTNASFIWVANPDVPLATARAVTHLSNRAMFPVFQPDGQGLAYVRTIPGSTTWELRYASLDGIIDRLLAPVAASVIGGQRQLRPRWNPTGTYVYVVLDDGILYRVGKQGGGLEVVSSVNHPLAAVDFHPGSGRLLAVSAAVSNTYPRDPIPANNYSAGPLAADRIALIDTSAAHPDTSYRFVLADGRVNRWPVYAPDGTRIAFSRFDPAHPGYVDVLTGRISPNHAPILQGIADQSIPACTPTSIQLSAADPDGEPVTYRADELPPGATLSASGAFSWGATTVGTYWGVFRALDGSGGVDTRVVRFNVYDAGGCGDPIDEGNGEGIMQGHHASRVAGRPLGQPETRVANSLLDGAESGAWAERTVRLVATSADEAGRCYATIGAHGAGPAELDRVRLLVVDHPDSTSAFATPSGVVVGARRPVAALNVDGGSDVTAMLTAGNGEPLSVPAGSTLLASPADDARGVVIECARIGGPGSNDSSEVLVEALENGAWHEAGRIHPRRSRDTLAVMTGAVTQVRLSPLGEMQLWALDGFVPGDPTSESVSTSVLEPASASVPGAQSALASADSTGVTLQPSQSLTLGFDPPAPAEGSRRSYFLQLRAKYDAGSAAAMARGQLEGAGLPHRFALYANQPNPFARTTTLRFDLPVATHVRIEVFDAQGRRVTTLLNGSQPAGAHTLVWTGATDDGASAPAGVYFARLTAGSFRQQRRMVLLGR